MAVQIILRRDDRGHQGIVEDDLVQFITFVIPANLLGECWISDAATTAVSA